MNWKRNLYAIWAAELLAVAGFNTSMPIIPFYLQDMGISDPGLLKFWVGIIQSTAAIAMGLIAPVWGRLADSYGRRMMLLRAMFGGAIVLALMGFVTTPWELLALRILQGLLTGTIAAATVLVAATVPAEEAGYGMGLLQTAVYVGATVGPMIGGLVSDFSSNRVTFFVTAGMLAAAGVIVWFFVEENFVPPDRQRRGLRGAMKPDFSVVLKSPLLIYLILIGFAVQIANGVVNPIMPLFVQQISANASRVAAISGLILGVGAFSSALSAAGLGRMSFRLGYNRMLFICMVGALVLQVPQAFVTSTTQLFVLRLLTGFFLGGAIPAVNALIANNTRKEVQGSVYGINTSVSAAGMAIGPAVGATVAVWFGYSSAFLATAVVLGGGALMVVLLARNSSAAQGESAQEAAAADSAPAGPDRHRRESSGPAPEAGGAGGAPAGVHHRPRIAWKHKE